MPCLFQIILEKLCKRTENVECCKTKTALHYYSFFVFVLLLFVRVLVLNSSTRIQLEDQSFFFRNKDDETSFRPRQNNFSDHVVKAWTTSKCIYIYFKMLFLRVWSI